MVTFYLFVMQQLTVDKVIISKIKLIFFFFARSSGCPQAMLDDQPDLGDCEPGVRPWLRRGPGPETSHGGLTQYSEQKLLPPTFFFFSSFLIMLLLSEGLDTGPGD